MKYFENIPKITYDEIYTVRNIFTKIVVEYLNKDFINYYKIENFSRLENISFKLYGTVDYWWVLALINDIQDPIFDLPLDDETLRTIVAEYDGTATEKLEYYDQLIEEQDAKRIIKVIKKEYIGRLLVDITRSLSN